MHDEDGYDLTAGDLCVGTGQGLIQATSNMLVDKRNYVCQFRICNKKAYEQEGTVFSDVVDGDVFHRTRAPAPAYGGDTSQEVEEGGGASLGGRMYMLLESLQRHTLGHVRAVEAEGQRPADQAIA